LPRKARAEIVIRSLSQRIRVALADAHAHDGSTAKIFPSPILPVGQLSRMAAIAAPRTA
jgi:hypothetical protein